MPDTPLNVSGRTDDAEGVARTIAGALEGSELRREGAGFRITVAARRRLRRSTGRAVTVNVDPGYFEGEPGLRQKLGLATFLGTQMAGTGLDEVLAMVRGLRMAVAIMAEAPIESTAGDELFRLAFLVAAAADGFVVDLGEGCVWSSDGRLLAATRDADEDLDEVDAPGVDRVLTMRSSTPETWSRPWAGSMLIGRPASSPARRFSPPRSSNCLRLASWPSAGA